MDPAQSDRQLVSTTSLKPALSFESTTTNTDDGEKNPSSIPTAEQEAAIITLRDVEETTIIAWLTLLRSIESGFQLRSGPGCLSSEQVAALNVLKDCQNGNVLAWLRYNLLADNVNVNKQLLERRSYASSRTASKRSTGSFSRFTRRSSARSSLRSSISSFGPPSPYNSAATYNPPRDSSVQVSPFPDGEDGHAHWCTYGEHKHPITTCDGWKRHEKEHETVYACMPGGPTEDRGLGPQCVFCGLQSPDSNHLQEHKISSCLDQSKRPVTRSRKPNMIKHLASHSVFGDDACILAERWRYMPNKKALSCGLCVMLFTSLTDRLNHIDQDHWSHDHDMGQWRLTTIIRGLLLQTKVIDAWQSLLASHSSLLESDFVWELPTAEGLQLRLETGEESGQALALAAFQLHTNASTTLRRGSTASIEVYAGEQMDLDSHFNLQDVTHPALTPAISFVPNATFMQRSTSVLRPTPTSSSNVVDDSTIDFCGSQFLQPSLTELFQSPFATNLSSNGLAMQERPVIDSNKSIHGQTLSSHAAFASQPPDPNIDPEAEFGHHYSFNASDITLIDQYIKTGEALLAFSSAGEGIYESATSLIQPEPLEGASTRALPCVNVNTGPRFQHEVGAHHHREKPLPALPLPPPASDDTLTLPLNSDFDSDPDIV